MADLSLFFALLKIPRLDGGTIPFPQRLAEKTVNPASAPTKENNNPSPDLPFPIRGE